MLIPDVFDQVTDAVLPSYDVAVGSAMPETASYDPLTRTISLGAGPVVEC